jgi:hypothetical protein
MRERRASHNSRHHSLVAAEMRMSNVGCLVDVLVKPMAVNAAGLPAGSTTPFFESTAFLSQASPYRIEVCFPFKPYLPERFMYPMLQKPSQSLWVLSCLARYDRK